MLETSARARSVRMHPCRLASLKLFVHRERRGGRERGLLWTLEEVLLLLRRQVLQGVGHQDVGGRPEREFSVA